MASERCTEQRVLGAMGSPFIATEFNGTRRGLRCEAQVKRSGNTAAARLLIIEDAAFLFYNQEEKR